jgi:putative tryptophan/tyrosine transport system substrate-binding protein
MSLLTSETFAKSTQLLKELLPTASVIAYLVNPSSPTAELYAKEASTAASALGITLRMLKARTDDELDEAFASLPKMGTTGSWCLPNHFSTATGNTSWPSLHATR